MSGLFIEFPHSRGFPNSIANNIAATYLRFLHTHKGFSVLKSQNFNHVAATLLELELEKKNTDCAR